MRDFHDNTDDTHAEQERLPHARPSQAKHRANALLEKILLTNAELLGDIADALFTSPDVIREYQAGLMIPIERQMLLAAYAIERAPQFARAGYALRSQLRAMIAFAARETETHNGSPPFGNRWT